jgi:quercetin dioxygenase-like cupin family protein
MNMEHIRKQTLPNDTCTPSGGCRILPLLVGEIRGVEAEGICIAESGALVMDPVADEQSVLFVTAGSGVIRHNARDFAFGSMAVFIPTDGRVTVEAEPGGVTLLRIRMKLTEDDKLFLQATSSARPYFVRYEEATPYSEAIKSAKTVSRTLVEENVTPRFAMGSEETTGPDEVGAHAHPMLEQFFWGLPGNCCRVVADGHEALFGERTLLHIPPGSSHGVRADTGQNMRYVWLDFFMQQEDVSYIAAAHTPLAPSKAL